MTPKDECSRPAARQRFMLLGLFLILSRFFDTTLFPIVKNMPYAIKRSTADKSIKDCSLNSSENELSCHFTVKVLKDSPNDSYRPKR
jgi:hypothetical protein